MDNTCASMTNCMSPFFLNVFYSVSENSDFVYIYFFFKALVPPLYQPLWYAGFRTKAHETNFLRAGFFLVTHTFQGFFKNLWHKFPFFLKYLFFCFKIVGNSYVTVSHCNARKFLCCGEPPQQRKIPLSQLTTATKEIFFVAVNHRYEEKFLSYSEPL